MSEKSQPAVTFHEVSHRFGKFTALDHLTLSIEHGDIYGLLGLNGAGKTTSIRLLLGYLTLQSGEIEILGRSRRNAGLEIASRVGATIEAPAFYPHLTGLKNLELLYNLNHRNKEGRTPAEALELVGLAQSGDIKVRKYSQGMTQRLYLAQAILGKPELLLLDEPTSNLDPNGIAEVRDLIRWLSGEQQVTVILSSHQLIEIEGLCNRVGIINRGRRILETGVAELFESQECMVHIEAEDIEKAMSFVSGLDWCGEPVIEKDRVRTTIQRGRRAELNGRLQAEGLAIAEFREHRPTLEDFFHQRIAADVE